MLFIHHDETVDMSVNHTQCQDSNGRIRHDGGGIRRHVIAHLIDGEFLNIDHLPIGQHAMRLAANDYLLSNRVFLPYLNGTYAGGL